MNLGDDVNLKAGGGFCIVINEFIPFMYTSNGDEILKAGGEFCKAKSKLILFAMLKAFYF